MRIDETTLTAYLDNELSAAARVEVEAALAESPELRATLARLHRETARLGQALDALRPARPRLSPYAALARLRSTLRPNSRETAPAETDSLAEDSLTVWESPSLWTSINQKRGGDNPRLQKGVTVMNRTFAFIATVGLLLTVVIAIVFFSPKIAPDNGQTPDSAANGVEPNTPQSDPPALPEGATPDGAIFGERIELVGYDLPTDPVIAGESSELTLYWRVLRAVEEDYHIFVHIAQPDEETILSQQDAPFVAAQSQAPAGGWSSDTLIEDAHALNTTAIPSGMYDLVIGLYDSDTGQRLALRTADDYIPPTASLHLTQIQIENNQVIEPLPPVDLSGLSYGIQAHVGGDVETNLDHLEALGMEWVKLQMAWQDVQPTPEEYVWQPWDALINAYTAEGVRVMLSITKTPDWARPADDDKSVVGPPAHPNSYADFVGQVAERYQDQVQAIEVWDEQNLWYKSGGRGRIDPAAYVDLLRQSHAAIKAANPEMLVISGGLTPAGNVGEMAVDDIEYLQQMYDLGAKVYFDLLGAHPKGTNCPVLADWRTVTPEEATATVFLSPFEERHHSWCFLGTLEAYREVMAANEDAHKMVAVTEFGWAATAEETPGYEFAVDNTSEEQAQWIIEAYQWAEAQGWIGPMILWNLDVDFVPELAAFSIIDRPVYDDLIALTGGNAVAKPVATVEVEQTAPVDPIPDAPLADETPAVSPPLALIASLSRGIHVNPVGDIEANLAHLETLGMEWVKLQMAWQDVEPTPGDYAWETWDQVIEAYAANDIEVMLTVTKAPDWARPTDDDKSVEGLPTDAAIYAEFVAQVAERYQGRVQAIEIWQGQNLWYYVGGMGRIDPAAYVELLRQSHTAIKAVNPEMLVVSGSLAPAGGVDGAAIDDVEYLQQMYDLGAKDYFDRLGALPGGFNCPALADWRTVTAAEATATEFLGPFRERHHSWCFLGTMTAYREVMVANGDADKMVAVTEFGWATAAEETSGYEFAVDNTSEEQAQWIVEAYAWAAMQGWVEPMILSNLDIDAVEEAAMFSIIDTPAYERLARLADESRNSSQQTDYVLKTIRQLTPCENRGRKQIFVKVQDENGAGLNGVPVEFRWGVDQSLIFETQTMANEAGRTLLEMTSGLHTVQLAGGGSEPVTGLTADHGLEEPCGDEVGNLPGQVSFEVVFEQRR